MKIHEAVDYCLAYHRSNSQINTMRSYEFLFYPNSRISSVMGIWRR